ncbi:E3 ubiquitin-protein ligase DZIP3-like [Stylophora pistillata]|uniref:E3 ubiquitin-protein ligase DZIP3-like n=1 Tax=Stylophora pistillata TaxID=50429 RepID=UPI000C04154D|nr:E3 ubiquitin-protein ligase DZIP3-like [Stylophora pistillata]
MTSEVTVPIARGGKCKVKSRRKKTRPREVLRPTDEKANFQRCTRLLIGGGTALLKEKFDQLCPPRDLPKVLADPSTKEKLLTEAKLTKPQWERLYPSRGAVAVSEDFDISLLFKLLTTITKIPAPDLGWNSKPHRKEDSLGADLARIKYYRNKVYGHVNQEMSLEEDDFHYYWDKIEKPLTRIAGSISREKKREWEKEIDNFKSNPLTANEERYVEETR